ncbi:hypothetical protein EI555_007421 [Monodon monoceros]|uniref:Uncharacterized protein n=1 Tax=Monodon monoceros TaxID=40151 RepID=A0A4U1EMI3_MONMO|nr:hypothetical protein EI555_007421 [Monodon monoceros]
MALLTTFHRKHHRLRTQCEGPGGTWTLRMTPKLTYLTPPPAHKGTQRTCAALHLSSASQLFQATLQEEPGTPFLINWGRCIIHISLKAEMSLGEPAQNATRGSLPCGGG